MNLIRSSLLLLCACCVYGGTISAAEIAPQNLRCEYLNNPLGIDALPPHLSWEVRTLHPGAKGVRQSAYQVQVASTPERLVAGSADWWDSGKVRSDETLGIAYAGRPLDSRSICHWRVRVWDHEDQVSPWSEPARWTVGLLRRRIGVRTGLRMRWRRNVKCASRVMAGWRDRRGTRCRPWTNRPFHGISMAPSINSTPQCGSRSIYTK